MILDITSFISFTKVFTENLNNHAPKDLMKAIMLRSRPWKIFLNKESLETKKTNKKNATFALVCMVKKTKKEHFQNTKL